MKFEKTVVHLIIKGASRENDTHAYFGSVACIYEHFSEEEIGVAYGTLRNYGINEDRPYENNKVIIRKGKLLTKDRSEIKE